MVNIDNYKRMMIHLNFTIKVSNELKTAALTFSEIANLLAVKIHNKYNKKRNENMQNFVQKSGLSLARTT